MIQSVQPDDKGPSPHYQLETLEVVGGKLKVARWGQSGPVILAIHGITASHREFLALADALGDGVQLIAPDLRGRGGSREITGPWGMRTHAADMVAVLDYFKINRADVVLGHSMGGFITAVMGAEYPARCGSLVMADGGLPFMPVLPIHRLPFGERLIEKLTQRLLGQALERLEMRFSSVEDYRAYWREHPALKDDWSHYIEDYVDYDLIGEVPELQPSTSRAALLQDVRTQFFENVIADSLRQLQGPVRFLRAPRGLMNDKPLYKPAVLVKASRKIKGFSYIDIPDTNHYTILISSHGASAVAEELKKVI